MEGFCILDPCSLLIAVDLSSAFMTRPFESVVPICVISHFAVRLKLASVCFYQLSLSSSPEFGQSMKCSGNILFVGSAGFAAVHSSLKHLSLAFGHHRLLVFFLSPGSFLTLPCELMYPSGCLLRTGQVIFSFHLVSPFSGNLLLDQDFRHCQEPGETHIRVVSRLQTKSVSLCGCFKELKLSKSSIKPYIMLPAPALRPRKRCHRRLDCLQCPDLSEWFLCLCGCAGHASPLIAPHPTYH